MMEVWQKLNHKKIAIISISVAIFSVLNGYVFFPGLIKFMLKRNLALRPGSQVRPLFQNIPFPLTFKVHIFNVTNPDEVTKGQKPNLVDIGPFIFDEWKLRDDVVDDKANDTLSYTLKNRFIFRPDLTFPLTGDEIVYIPNIIMLGAFTVIKKDREAMLPFVIQGMRGIFQEPKSPFIKVRVMDFLFDGVEFTCDGDFNTKTLCTALESEAGEVEAINETLYKFSLLADKNRTNVGRFTVKRGVHNIHDLGRIVTFDNQPAQSIWEGDICNMINGTDSTIFPPFLTREEGIWAFSPELCMSIKSYYVKETSFDGMPTREYTADFGDFRNQPHFQCFCEEAPDECPPKGTIDMFPCVKAPIFGSKPHFLDADPYLLSTVNGLNPDRKLHDIYVNFEPITGTPFEGYKRLQFNFQIEPIEEYDLVANMPNLILPLVWVEEGAKLNRTYTNLLKYQLFLGMKVNSALKWMGMIIGSIMFIASLVTMQQQKSQESSGTSKVTSVKPVETSN